MGSGYRFAQPDGGGESLSSVCRRWECIQATFISIRIFLLQPWRRSMSATPFEDARRQCCGGSSWRLIRLSSSTQRAERPCCPPPMDVPILLKTLCRHRPGSPIPPATPRPRMSGIGQIKQVRVRTCSFRREWGGKDECVVLYGLFVCCGVFQLPGILVGSLGRHVCQVAGGWAARFAPL